MLGTSSGIPLPPFLMIENCYDYIIVITILSKVLGLSFSMTQVVLRASSQNFKIAPIFLR
ncbi:MAG: hypothetical protein D6742_03685 [Cyanobacteria bacterium J069]|nr:MAG: hypothetical protein D6742_03685 [Cyanobacteria bacterium J069]